MLDLSQYVLIIHLVRVTKLAWYLIFFSSNSYRDGDPPLIVAIDLQPMAPIDGVIQVQGDITNARTAEVVM